ncbi:MAG TPA: TIR domain-containing protein [Pyrinomonadaceae bacterium]|jgi:TolB-like protein
MPHEPEFEYDVFISYSRHDQEWVRDELLKIVEEVGLRAFVDFRDFKSGAPSIKEMERGVTTSRKTLLVLTPNYIKSEWCEIESIMLHTLDPANRNLRLIPLLKTQCERPLRLGALTHVDFTDDADFELAWQQLLTALAEPLERTAEKPPEVQAKLNRSASYIAKRIGKYKSGIAIALFVLLLSAVGLFYWVLRNPAPIGSIAVLPFVNESGDPDVEYLSEGMSESLINSLAQLPHLSVKARSSVFRYKGKEIEPRQVAAELSVQAILGGRFVLRGDDVTLNLSLDDGRTGDHIWGEQYRRKKADLVSLQKDIVRNVSQKLGVPLSKADDQKLAKNYPENVEAYDSYANGRYHVLKLTPKEMQTGIDYFNKAIAIDPSYARAYVGLADAYRSSAIAGEMPSKDLFPEAKANAQKAIQIDDTLAEAHAELGFIMSWYDWDWRAAENEFKRALELNSNDADTHWFYAHLLSNTGRHAEALSEIRRAKEIDPLSLRINANEGQFLLHAGRTDEALASLQKTFELDSNFWLAHLFASSAYIEKGMFDEGIAEARKAEEFSGPNTHPIAFEGYALAKSGKRASARAVLAKLLQLSTKRYVSPYCVALIYNGLDERDKTLTWLEKGSEQRDPKMVFLRVEPKWNNLREDRRFQDFLRRVGLMP